MSEQERPDTSPDSRNTTSQVDILDILIALARHKYFILKTVVGITLIALVISLVWPQTFRSSATFLPPKQSNVLPGGLGGILGSSLGGLGMGSNELNAEAALNILKSRSIREELIREFELEEVYGSTIMEQLLRNVQNNTTIEETREGGFGFSPLVYIEIAFDDEEPARAQQVVEFYISKLDSTVQAINQRYAENSFDMINERYLQNQEDLARAERELKEFQERYGIFEVEEQARIMIQNIAELKGREIELDVQINVLRQTVSDTQADLRNLLRTREEVRRQIREMIEMSEEQAPEFAFFPLQDLPELALEYLRLYREVEIQNEVMKAIYPQLQYQEMMLQTRSANIQVVDAPHLPTYKESPKRALIVIAGTLFAIFLSLLIVFYRELMERGRRENSAQYRKLNELSEYLHPRRKDGFRDEAASS